MVCIDLCGIALLSFAIIASFQIITMIAIRVREFQVILDVLWAHVSQLVQPPVVASLFGSWPVADGYGVVIGEKFAGDKGMDDGGYEQCEND